MLVNKEHYANTLEDLTTKAAPLTKTMAGMMIDAKECGCQLNHYFKFTKELNQAVNQECIKALAFN
jgi:hypothetical protein